MLKSGILNPALLELLARIRHTNTLVSAGHGFPFGPIRTGDKLPAANPNIESA